MGVWGLVDLSFAHIIQWRFHAVLAAGKRILSDDEPGNQGDDGRKREAERDAEKPDCECHGGNRQQNPVEQFQGQGDQNSGQASNRIIRHPSDSHRNCDEQGDYENHPKPTSHYP